MAGLFVQISVSADGFIEDADGKLDWFTEDKTAEDYATDTLRSIGGMVFGRTAHALLAEFWKNAPSDDPSPDLPEQARLMNGLPKYVLTHGTLEVDWQHSHRVTLHDLHRIKREASRPIALFAGASAGTRSARSGPRRRVAPHPLSGAAGQGQAALRRGRPAKPAGAGGGATVHIRGRRVSLLGRRLTRRALPVCAAAHLTGRRTILSSSTGPQSKRNDRHLGSPLSRAAYHPGFCASAAGGLVTFQAAWLSSGRSDARRRCRTACPDRSGSASRAAVGAARPSSRR